MTDQLTDEAVKAMLAHYDLPTDCDCDDDDCVKCSHYPTFQERASKQLKDAAPDLARALLDARAERDSIGTMYATVAEENKALGAERDRLRAMLTPPDDLRTYTVDYLVHNDDHGLPGDMPMVPADTANRLRADAQAAVALVVERAADACVDLAAQVSNAALTGLPEQARLRESMEAAFTKASHVIRALAPADGIAAVEALRVEARENAMQALASMGQAQEAYEAQLEAEAELAAAQQREAVAYRDGWRFAYRQCLATGSVPDPDYKGGATLTPTEPGDGWTWNERLGWIGPDGKPADPRRRG